MAGAVNTLRCMDVRAWRGFTGQDMRDYIDKVRVQNRANLGHQPLAGQVGDKFPPVWEARGNHGLSNEKIEEPSRAGLPSVTTGARAGQLDYYCSSIIGWTPILMISPGVTVTVLPARSR